MYKNRSTRPDRNHRSGLQIAKNPTRIQQKGARRWKVMSQSVAKLWYLVVLGSAGLTCQCPQHEKGTGFCKHMIAVDAIIAKMWNKCRHARMTVLRMPDIACHHCRSKRYVRNGNRINQSQNVQRYRCRDCKRTFSGLAGFRGRDRAPNVITRALREVAHGLSPKGVQSVMAGDGIRVHQSTIHRWSKDYADMMSEYSKSIRPWTGYRWHCDEIYLKIRGQGRWLFAVMDSFSRTILAYEVSHTKMNFDPYQMFVAARTQAGVSPWVLVTDGLQVFCAAATKAFWCRKGFRFTHVRDIHLQKKFNNNNLHERLNGKFKDRIKTVRGFKSEDPALIHLMMIHHNFFRSHSGIGNITPAEKAGIRIQGSDKWMTFICNAAIHVA